jgi:uncharacterized protein (DUF302 family)
VNVFIESPHCEVYKYCRALFVMDAGYPIGFIGLGTMGEAMALSLVKAGTRLLVWNRTRAKAEILAAAGADITREADEFWTSTQQARTVGELEKSIQKALGRTGLMSFVQFDHGAIVRKATGHDKPRMVRLVVGNPLIMQEMAKYVPDADSYAPVTVLVDERSDGVHLSYDRMASFLAPYGNSDALAVAHNLDKKVEDLLLEAAA